MEGRQPSTALIMARRALELPCGDETIHWAEALLEAGVDGHHVRMLAGAHRGGNHFELAALRDRVCEELRIVLPGREDALVNLAVEWLREAGDDTDALWHATVELRKLAIAAEYPRILMPWYLLAFASEALRDEGTQFYIPEVVDRDQLDARMRATVQEFIAQHSETSNRPLHPTAAGEA